MFYVFVNVIVFLVGGLVDEIIVDIGVIEEVLIENVLLVFYGVVWELDQKLDSFVMDELCFVVMIFVYCELLMEWVVVCVQIVIYFGVFEGNIYWIEVDDMIIVGFILLCQGKGMILIMQFKKLYEVVGNYIVKYQVMKLVKMLMVYDFDCWFNFFVELGGFIFIFMGDGVLGMGKIMLIQMMVGMVNDYCQVVGYLFCYQNFGIDNIDSY